jgi:hypothetical protein
VEPSRPAKRSEPTGGAAGLRAERMSRLARWAPPFAGAVVVLGSVAGVGYFSRSGFDVSVPSAAVVRTGAIQPGGNGSPAVPQDSPFTVVYPKRSIDVVEVPDGERKAGGQPMPTAQPAPAAAPSPVVAGVGDGGGDGGGVSTPASGTSVSAAVTTQARETRDDSESRTPSPSPRPTPSPTSTRTWTRSPTPTPTARDDDGHEQRSTTPGP